MKKQNILIVVLLLSVSVNLFLLGGIGARLNSANSYREARPFPPNIGWIVRDLSEARQNELGEILEPLGSEISPYRSAMFEAQRRVNELMATPDFQQDELETAFEKLREASQSYTALSHQQTIRVLSELTEEERAVAREFVQRRGPRDGRDGMRRPGPPGGGPGFGPPGAPDGRRRPDGSPQPPPRPDL